MTRIGTNDFTPNGDLRSHVKFSWTGEIQSVQIKRYARMSKVPGQEGEVETESYYLEISDPYGFSFSFFRRGLSQESAYAHAAKIPYGQTLMAEGDVKVRKGRTFFNMSKLIYPDDTPVFLWELETDNEREMEGEL